MIWRDGSWRGADGGLPAASGLLSTILSGPVPPASTRVVPSDVVGCSLEVASDGKWVGKVGIFASTTARDTAIGGATSNLATDGRVTADVGLDLYRWSTGGLWWGDLKNPVAYASLPALADGSFAICPRALGNGTFRVKRIGGLWRVETGEAVVMGTGPGDNGYDLTAAGASTVQLDTCVIPAGLIKVGEIWAVTTHATKSMHVSGSDIILVRWADVLAIGNNSVIPASAPAFHYGDVNVGWIDATSCQRRLGSGRNNEGATGGANTGVGTINENQNLSLAVTPGGAGNAIKVHNWAFRRVA